MKPAFASIDRQQVPCVWRNQASTLVGLRRGTLLGAVLPGVSKVVFTAGTKQGYVA